MENSHQAFSSESSNTGFYATAVPEVAFLSLLDIIPGDANATINALNATLTEELAYTKITPLYAAQLAIQLDWLRRKDIAHTEFIVLPGGGLTATPPTQGSSYMSFTSGLMVRFQVLGSFCTSIYPLFNSIHSVEDQ